MKIRDLEPNDKIRAIDGRPLIVVSVNPSPIFQCAHGRAVELNMRLPDGTKCSQLCSDLDQVTPLTR